MDTTKTLIPLEKQFLRLLEIITCLRGPDGCPWDRAQTFRSMRSCLLEECWEVLDTLERNDLPHLQEELGDLLLNILLLADIANQSPRVAVPCSLREAPEETHKSSDESRLAFGSSHFLAGVFEQLCHKLVRRHPHVFAAGAEKSASSTEEALENWSEAKNAEKQTPAGVCFSVLDGVNPDQAALLYALKLQKNAAKAGFDWPSDSANLEVQAKIQEELCEFSEALQQDSEPERMEEELGDLLFSVVNLARIHKLNPEIALVRSSKKFRRRFQFIEPLLSGENPTAMDLLWQEAKQAELGS